MCGSSVIYSFCTVHVTSYLRKSADLRGNLLWVSVKVCVKIRRSSVASPRNRLSGSTELSFGNPRNCLSGVRGFVLWESSKLSLGDCRLSSLQNCLWESAKSSSGIVNLAQIAVQFPSKVPRQPFSGSFCRYVRRFYGYPSMFPRIVCDDSAEDSQKSASCCVEVDGSLQAATRKFMEFHKLLHGIARKTYTANPRNSVTNLWHVPYVCTLLSLQSLHVQGKFLCACGVGRWDECSSLPPPMHTQMHPCYIIFFVTYVSMFAVLPISILRLRCSSLNW